MSSPLRFAFQLFAHILWPVACPVCGALSEVLCPGCRDSLFSPPLPRCLSCGKIAPCGDHPNAPFIWAGARYEGAMRKVIHELKYHRFQSLAPRLGEGLAGLWPRPELDLLVPVPLHRRSRRPYNQALEIALGLGKAWNCEVSEAAVWACDVPVRTGLGRSERLSLRSDVFEVQGVGGLRVGLVDDVSTTGRTLACLASCLRRGGAEVAGAWVLAGTK